MAAQRTIHAVLKTKSSWRMTSPHPWRGSVNVERSPLALYIVTTGLSVDSEVPPEKAAL
jgi:hypothetical protein